MNTEDIERALKPCKPLFLGVFSSDNLPTNPRGVLISNTDPSHLPGTHWVVIYVDEDGKRGEYFDSFGMQPTTPFRDYLNRYCKHWIFNTRQIQSVVSRFCGHYCIYFALLKCKGIDLRKIVDKFTRDTGFNDYLVHSFTCSLK